MSSLHATVDHAARPQLGRNLTYGMLDSLGRAIVTGHYDNKPFPTEADLAKQHGVSRSVTREAVKMLTAKGLLSARPRQGTIDPAGELVEPVRHRCAALAARTANSRSICCGSSTSCASRSSRRRRRWRRASAAKRTGAASAAGLARMEAAERGRGRSARRRYRLSRRDPARLGKPVLHPVPRCRGRPRCAPRSASPTGSRAAPPASRDHAAVRDAIEARDADAARAAMRHLIGDVLELIEQVEAGDVPNE